MANKRFYQFLYSKQPKLTMMNGLVTFNASGGIVGSATSSGIYSVSQVGGATGTYQIKLADNYYSFIGASFKMYSGIGAVTTNVSSLTGSSVYEIASVGNSNWTTVGLDTDYTPAVGQPFVATAVAGSGTGTAKLLTASNIASVQVLQNQQSELTNLSPNKGKGSSIWFQTMLPSVTTTQTGASSTSYTSTVTMAATAPTGSTQMSFKLWFRDSSALP